jgi:RNA polymerase sigma factor (sigma-70 family)
VGATDFSGQLSTDDPTLTMLGASDLHRERTARRSAAAAWHDYEAVYTEHHEKLYQFALLLTDWNRPLAEDIVSDVFIQLHDRWAEGKLTDFGAYARTAVVNRIRSHGRHNSVVDRFVRRPRGDERGQRDMAEQATDHHTLRAALRALPPRQRDAILLRYYGNMSVKETAQLLGVTTGTVKSQVSDALRSMRRSVGEPDVD